MTGAPSPAHRGQAPVPQWALPTFAAMIGAFMVLLDSTIVNVAIPHMMNVFHTTTSGIEWVSTAYLLALGVVTPLSGWLGDYLGYKRLYLVALALFTLASGLCAFSGSLEALIGFRILQALGGGLIMPMVMAMVMQMVPRERLGTAMGIFGMAMLLAPAIGPTLGGYLVEYVDWRWIFTINLPIGVAAFLLAQAVLPPFDDEEAGRFDWPGALLVAPGLFALLLALSKGQEWGWGSERTVFLFYAAFVLLALFVWRELTTPEPLLDLRLFRYPSFALGTLVLFVLTIGLFGALFYLPIFLQNVRGLGAFQAGLLLLPPALVTGAVMPIAGQLYDRFGPRFVVPVGILLLAWSTFLFRHLTLYTPLSTIVLWSMVRSLGLGLSMMPVQSAMLAEVPPLEASRASAISNIVNRVAGSFGIAILTVLFTDRLTLHENLLRGEISALDPFQLQAFQRLLYALQAQGLSPVAAQAAAAALLGGKLQALAFTKALNDAFVFMAFALLLGLVPALFLRKGQGRPRSLSME